MENLEADDPRHPSSTLGGRLTTPEYWDSYVRRFQMPRMNDPRRMPWRAIDRVLHRHLPRGRLAIVEVGCAASAWLPAFAARGHACFGVDYSPIGCALAAANLRAHGADAGIWCADLFAPSVEPGRFDVVFSNGLVEHFEDTPAVIGALASLVRPGGVVVTLVPNLLGIGGQTLRRLNARAFAQHVPLAPVDLRQAHGAVGLETAYAAYCGVWFPFLMWMLPPGRPRALRLGLKAFVHGTARPIWAVTAMTGRYPEARWTSPYVLAIAVRPQDVPTQR